MEKHMFPINECTCGLCRDRANVTNVTQRKRKRPTSIKGMAQIDSSYYEVPEVSKHHLFTRDDIREKLIEILGEPITEQGKERLEKEITMAWNAMPLYTIDHKLHLRIHKQQLLRKQLKTNE